MKTSEKQKELKKSFLLENINFIKEFVNFTK